MSAEAGSLHVHPGRCIGAGQCALAAPEVFDQADDGTVVVRADAAQRTDAVAAAVAVAVAVCPARALELRRARPAV